MIETPEVDAAVNAHEFTSNTWSRSSSSRPARSQRSTIASLGEGSFVREVGLPVLCGHLYKKSPSLRLKAWDWRFFAVTGMRLLWWRNKKEAMSINSSLFDDEEEKMREWGRLPSTRLAASSTRMSESERAGTGKDRRRRPASAPPVKRLSQSFPHHGSVDKDMCKGFINLLRSPVRVEADPYRETVFTLKPKQKVWAIGATTDKNQDDHRVYEFDVTGSEHSRDVWMEAIITHSAMGEVQRIGMNRDSQMEFYDAEGCEVWVDESLTEEQMQAAEAAKEVAKKFRSKKVL